MITAERKCVKRRAERPRIQKCPDAGVAGQTMQDIEKTPDYNYAKAEPVPRHSEIAHRPADGAERIAFVLQVCDEAGLLLPGGSIRIITAFP